MAAPLPQPAMPEEIMIPPHFAGFEAARIEAPVRTGVAGGGYEVEGPLPQAVMSVTAQMPEPVVPVAAPMPDPGPIEVNYPEPVAAIKVDEPVKVPAIHETMPAFSESVATWLNSANLESQIPSNWLYQEMPVLEGHYNAYDGLGFVASGLNGLAIPQVSEAILPTAEKFRAPPIMTVDKQDFSPKDVYASTYAADW